MNNADGTGAPTTCTPSVVQDAQVLAAAGLPPLGFAGVVIGLASALVPACKCVALYHKRVKVRRQHGYTQYAMALFAGSL